jgi:hypothetical protein
VAPLDEGQIEQHKAWVRSITNVPGLHRSEIVLLKNGPQVYKFASLLYCGRTADDITKTELRFQTSKLVRGPLDSGFERTGDPWHCENDEIGALRAFLNEEFDDDGDYHLLRAGVDAGQVLDYIRSGDVPTGFLAAMAQAIASRTEIVSTLSESEGARLVGMAVDLRHQELITEEFAAIVDDPFSSEADLQGILEKNLWLLGSTYVKKADRRSFGVLDQYDLVLLRSDNVGHIVELKKANVPKLVQKYRNHFIVGSEVHQAVSQVTNYLRYLDENRDMILNTFGVDCRRIKATVIIGHPDYNTQDGATSVEVREAIRTYNSHFSRVEVLTYEDLLQTANNSITALAQQVRDESTYVEVDPDEFDDFDPDNFDLYEARRRADAELYDTDEDPF